MVKMITIYFTTNLGLEKKVIQQVQYIVKYQGQQHELVPTCQFTLLLFKYNVTNFFRK